MQALIKNDYNYTKNRSFVVLSVFLVVLSVNVLVLSTTLVVVLEPL